MIWKHDGGSFTQFAVIQGRKLLLLLPLHPAQRQLWKIFATSVKAFVVILRDNYQTVIMNETEDYLFPYIATLNGWDWKWQKEILTISRQSIKVITCTVLNLPKLKANSKYTFCCSLQL